MPVHGLLTHHTEFGLTGLHLQLVSAALQQGPAACKVTKALLQLIWPYTGCT